MANSEWDEIGNMLKQAEAALKEAKAGIDLLTETGDITDEQLAGYAEAEAKVKTLRNAFDKLTNRRR
jgi:phage-related minor tail protein